MTVITIRRYSIHTCIIGDKPIDIVALFIHGQQTTIVHSEMNLATQDRLFYSNAFQCCKFQNV